RRRGVRGGGDQPGGGEPARASVVLLFDRAHLRDVGPAGGPPAVPDRRRGGSGHLPHDRQRHRGHDTHGDPVARRTGGGGNGGTSARQRLTGAGLIGPLSALTQLGHGQRTFLSN